MKELINNPFYRGSPFADKVDAPFENEAACHPFTRCRVVTPKDIPLAVDNDNRNLGRKILQKIVEGIYNLARR